MTESISAGGLEVSGTLTGVFDGEGANLLAELLGFSYSPRHDMRVAFPDGADRRCPACQEPATAVTVEGISFLPTQPVVRADGVSWRMAGFDETGYRCEPCGHRFGRGGKEIADGA